MSRAEPKMVISKEEKNRRIKLRLKTIMRSRGVEDGGGPSDQLKPLLSLYQKQQILGRDLYRDREFAVALTSGLEWQAAAEKVGMEEWMAEVVLNTDSFKALLRRVQESRENEVYGKDPDKVTEALAMGNVWVLREIRDNPNARDADRLRCALILHEMRPSVIAKRVAKGEEGVRVSFNTDVMDRLQEGLRKIKGQPVIEIEATPEQKGEKP